MTNVFNGMFGNIAPGMCKLSLSGGIAVKTGNGYKSYNIKTGRLTNCDSFVFPDMDEFFFVIPTTKAKTGDIIITSQGGKPKCVIEASNNEIKAINYEDSTIETIVPERHIFMGNTYFYGKIVSMFGDNIGSSKNSMQQMMKFMMLSKMFGGQGVSTENNSMSAMLPFMLLGGSDNLFGNMFNEIFDPDEDNETSTTESEAI